MGVRRVPWTSWAALAAALSMLVGWDWDISWHRSIGRDTAWTPAHVAIYISLAIAFVANALVVLDSTFGRNKSAPGVKVLGFRGPTGAFVTLFAVLMQFVGILFDVWWHAVYGVDAAMFTTPHSLIALGIWIFFLGQFLVTAREVNLTAPENRPLVVVAILIMSMFIGYVMIGNDPTYGPLGVRSQAFMISCALLVPFPLLLIQEFLDWKWAGAVCAALYFAMAFVLGQVFQLFPAHPRFGPVYHRINVFLPPAFPLLLVVPAAVMGWIAARRTGRLVTFLWLGIAFVAVFTATNWATSAFLASPAARNRFFWGHLPGTVFMEGLRIVPPIRANAEGALFVALAVAIATVSAWSGARIGHWMRGVVR
ncbi:MAG TPA: hypothetical protein VFB67_05275 [Candidatus Polarisedimenticolaceae bacterium]|nr:hypothetical protein [Candidatus Polarisedimenticolaceae bacterium]